MECYNEILFLLKNNLNACHNNRQYIYCEIIIQLIQLLEHNLCKLVELFVPELLILERIQTNENQIFDLVAHIGEQLTFEKSDYGFGASFDIFY